MAGCFFKIDCRSEKDSKKVSIYSTGHAKNCLTVLLSAKGDGTKLKLTFFYQGNDLARIGKEIWKQSNLGIPGYKLYESGFYGRLPQLHY